MNKRIAFLMLNTLIIATLLAACGGTPATTPETQPQDQPTEPAAAEGPRELVVTGFGGTWADCMTETVITPFEQQFNAKLTLALPGSSTDILAKLRAEKDNPTMDVVLIGGGLEEVAAAEGLMEEINWAEQTSNWNDLIPEAQTVPGYGPSVAMAATGIGYNTEKMPFEPSSWLDFWDERLAGEGLVGVYNMDANYGLAMTAVLNDISGGTGENVDPAFEKYKALMETHRPLILVSTQDVVDAFTQKDAYMAIGPNSRFIAMAKEGLPIKVVYPEEGGFIWGNFAGIPKGSPHVDLAIDFVDFYLDPEVQKNWATCVNYSPSNTKVDLTGYEYEDALIVKNVFPLDWDWINTNRASWIERWNSEVLPLLNP